MRAICPRYVQTKSCVLRFVLFSQIRATGNSARGENCAVSGWRYEHDVVLCKRHGGEQEIVEHYRGSALVLEFRGKVRIEMAVSEPFLEPTILSILSVRRAPVRLAMERSSCSPSIA